MSDDALLVRVLAEAPSLPFVSLVHWLERLLDAEVGARCEAIALRHDPALAFHAGDQQATKRADAPGVVVTTAFAGLTGAVSPLPTPALEALARDDDRELPEHALLDLFHHRLLALLYRGLRTTDPAREGGDVAVHDLLLGLAGLPVHDLAAATSLPRARVLQLAPLLITQAPQAARLRAALHHQLGPLLDGAVVQVISLRGAPVALAADARARLGVDLRLGGASVLGARCPAPAGGIDLVLGPLTAASFLALRPGGAASALLVGVVRLMVPESVTVRIHLRPVALPDARLGDAQLGSAWLAGGHAPPHACAFSPRAP